MTTENFTKKDCLILEAVLEAHNAVDIGELKNLSMEMYSSAQCCELFGASAEQRYSNFHLFKIMYNMFLKIEMYYHPTMTGVNTI